MANGTAPVFMQREPTALVNATTTASAVTIVGTGDTVRIANNGTNAIRIAFGCAAADALANCVAPTTSVPTLSMLVFPSGERAFGITSNVGAVAVMTLTGTCSVEITRGDGG
jgi:hypothetical protein